MTRMSRRGRWVVMAFVAVCMAPPVAAGETIEADRKALLDHLQRTQSAFLTSIEGVSEAQWNWKPGPDRWSVADVAEHITTAEAFLRGLVTDRVMQAPAPPELLEKTKGQDAVVLRTIPDRSAKVQAPEPLQPKGAFEDKASVIAAFKEARAETIRLAGDGGRDLRAYAMDSPLGALDAYQWLLFVTAHTERHTKQIVEVKTTAGFPAK